MSRHASLFKEKPSQEDEALAAEVQSSNLLLIQRMGPTMFCVKSGDHDQSFKVSIGEPHSCTCRKGKPALCVHIVFIMIKVLKVPLSSPLWFQLSLNEADISRAVQCESEHLQQRQQSHRYLTRSKAGPSSSSSSSSSSSEASRRALRIDEDCPICLNSMAKLLPIKSKPGKADTAREGAEGEENGGEREDEGGGSEGGAGHSKSKVVPNAPLAQCERGCGNYVHAKCMREWSKHALSVKEHISCPLCRCDWGPDTLARLEKILRQAAQEEIRKKRLRQFKQEQAEQQKQLHGNVRLGRSDQHHHRTLDQDTSLLANGISVTAFSIISSSQSNSATLSTSVSSLPPVSGSSSDRAPPSLSASSLARIRHSRPRSYPSHPGASFSSPPSFICTPLPLATSASSETLEFSSFASASSAGPSVNSSSRVPQSQLACSSARSSFRSSLSSSHSSSRSSSALARGRRVTAPPLACSNLASNAPADTDLPALTSFALSSSSLVSARPNSRRTSDPARPAKPLSALPRPRSFQAPGQQARNSASTEYSHSIISHDPPDICQPMGTDPSPFDVQPMGTDHLLLGLSRRPPPGTSLPVLPSRSRSSQLKLGSTVPRTAAANANRYDVCGTDALTSQRLSLAAHDQAVARPI